MRFSSREYVATMRTRRYGLPFISLAAAAVVAALFVLRAPHAVPSALPSSTSPEEPWPMYQRYPSHNAVLPQGGLRLHWLAQLGDKVNGGLAISGGTVYAVSFDKKLYAIDERTGAIRWTAQADNVLMSTPVLENGVVIVGSGRDGFLRPDDYMSQIWGRPQGDDVYAFSTNDGHLIWKMHTVGQNMPSPAITGDTAILANGDLHAYAIDLQSGKPRWTADLAGVPTMSSVNLAGGVAFVSTCHNAPYVCETRAIDVRDGRAVWTSPIGGSDCAPALDAGKVFVNSSSDDDTRFHTGGVVTVAALDQRSGKTLWTYRSPPGPYTYLASRERQIAGTAYRGVLYQPLGNANEVVALHESNGKPLWAFRTSGPVKMSPVIKGNVVYFGDTAGIFYRVDRVTGHLLHATSYLQAFSTSPPVIAGNTVFVAMGNIVMAVPIDEI